MNENDSEDIDSENLSCNVHRKTLLISENVYRISNFQYHFLLKKIIQQKSSLPAIRVVISQNDYLFFSVN